MDIQFTSQMFKEVGMDVAYAPEPDMSSCARTKAKAERNLREAVRLFLKEAEKIGTPEQVFEEAGVREAEGVLMSLTTPRNDENGAPDGIMRHIFAGVVMPRTAPRNHENPTTDEHRWTRITFLIRVDPCPSVVIFAGD